MLAYLKRQAAASMRLNFHQESLQLFANATSSWGDDLAVVSVSFECGGSAAAAIEVANNSADTVVRIFFISTTHLNVENDYSVNIEENSAQAYDDRELGDARKKRLHIATAFGGK